ncbi:MAG TPA: hypothetical protein VGH39_15775 [Xanthobacteraceae bacterium]|jgi:hypothetical protein
MADIKESDWKIFKGLREVALERFCEQVLDDIARISSDTAKTKHERYLKIYRLVRERDKEIDPIFDYLRRSAAIRQICAFRAHDLLTAEELQQFSPELVKSVERIVDIMNQPIESVHPHASADEASD